MRHRHCYDEETEVLTQDGFKKSGKVVLEDRLGIWDSEKGLLCYERPEYLTVETIIGPKCIRSIIVGIDLMVTPES